MINLTNTNQITFTGEFPPELITFLDPSIEYLNLKHDGKKLEIRLKFKEKEEIILYDPVELNKYLSSGTIKGINVFLNAMLACKNGGYVIVDELENHFNREIVSTLIRFFMNEKINHKGATINGKTIATSEMYTTKDSCKNGIQSVKDNASTAEIKDLT